ncbi:hypothetical protein [Thauera mechernichensis]
MNFFRLIALRRDVRAQVFLLAAGVILFIAGVAAPAANVDLFTKEQRLESYIEIYQVAKRDIFSPQFLLQDYGLVLIFVSVCWDLALRKSAGLIFAGSSIFVVGVLLPFFSVGADLYDFFLSAERYVYPPGDKIDFLLNYLWMLRSNFIFYFLASFMLLLAYLFGVGCYNKNFNYIFSVIKFIILLILFLVGVFVVVDVLTGRHWELVVHCFWFCFVMSILNRGYGFMFFYSKLRM